MATYCYHERMFKCDGFRANRTIIINLHLDFSNLSRPRRCHDSEHLWSSELVMVGGSATIVILMNSFGPFYRLDSSMIEIEQMLVGQMLTDADWAEPSVEIYKRNITIANQHICFSGLNTTVISHYFLKSALL